MSIGKNIKKLRQSRGLSQKELAAIAGVTDKAVSTWETGANVPRMVPIQKMADYFGIKKSDIIEGESSKTSIYGGHIHGEHTQHTSKDFITKDFIAKDFTVKDFVVKEGKVLAYGDLPEDAQKELESYFLFLRQKHNI